MNDDENLIARVAHTTDEFSAAINKGSSHEVKVGDIYLIYALGPELTDPDTGEPLGKLELVRGRAKVTHVQERISTVETVEYEEIPGRRRIVKREGGMNAALGIALGVPQREEIEEGAERVRKAIDAEPGDYAKLLRSR